MKPVITQAKWASWCAKKRLPTQTGRFALETCYYGSGWRTRPGTLVLTREALIHHSYSWRDTLFAMFEPSLQVSLPVVEIVRVAPLRLTLGWKLIQGFPESCFRVFMQERTFHDLLLQRSGEEFRQALVSRGVPIESELPTA